MTDAQKQRRLARLRAKAKRYRARYRPIIKIAEGLGVGMPEARAIYAAMESKRI